MAGMPWFRLYAEMIDDPKIGRLNDAQFRLWIEILCLACKGEDGNTLQTIDDINWSLRRNVTETLHELLHETLVKLDDKEMVYVTNWEKRQFSSDNSTDRVRKYRENNKKVKGNVTETLQKRKCNAIEQNRTDTDTDTDKNREEISKKTTTKTLTQKQLLNLKPDDVKQESWVDFMELRKRKKAEKTEKAMSAVCKSLDECVTNGVSKQAMINLCLEEGWKGVNYQWYLNRKGVGNERSADKHGNFSDRDYKTGSTDIESLDWANG